MSSGAASVTPRVAEVRYAVRDGAHIAYQTAGEGPLDVVDVSIWFTHMEGRWELPGFAHFHGRLASFARVLGFDKTGIGLSDPVAPNATPPLEEWVEDVRAVMDAAGMERAAVVGATEGSMMAAMFAAFHPERVSALVLMNGTARLRWAPGYDAGIPPETCDQLVEFIARTFSTGECLPMLQPSLAGDPAALAATARVLRMSASPATAAEVVPLLFDLDVRTVLPSIRAPTLVLHRRDVAIPPVEQGRYLARAIPGARFVELPGSDYGLLAETPDLVADEIESFLTGAVAGPTLNRSLAVLLFADVSRSTERLAASGDRRWRELLDEHDAAARRLLELYDGTLVDTAGDGVFATFTGAARAIAFAQALRAATPELGPALRVGIHVGEVERRAGGVTGLAVHIAARIQGEAEPGGIAVSRTVRDLAQGAQLRFAPLGRRVLKGVPDEWQLFAVV